MSRKNGSAIGLSGRQVFASQWRCWQERCSSVPPQEAFERCQQEFYRREQANVAAFLPLGALAPAVSARWRSWPRVLSLGLAVSFAIEVAQLAISLLAGHPYRRGG